MTRDKGKINDLMERLQREEITIKETFKELKERGLVEQERWEIIPWVTYFVFLLPLNFKFSAKLPIS